MEFKPNVVFKIPVIVTKGAVIYPLSNITLSVERNFSINSFNDAKDNYESYCVLVTQKDPSLEVVKDVKDVASYGTLCRINSFQNLKGNGYRALFNGLERVKISNIYLESEIIYVEGAIEEDIQGDERVEKALVKKIFEQISSGEYNISFKRNDKDLMNKLSSGISGAQLSYVMSDLCQFSIDQKVEILSTADINKRLEIILTDLSYVKESIELEAKIDDMVRKSAEKSQKEYILREKMRAIAKELGDVDVDYEADCLKKLDENPYPEEVKDKVKSELKRYKTMPQGALEGSLIKDYIDTVFSIPWFEKTIDNDNIKNVKKVLDEDHYGLKKVKERILEYLAVKAINGNLKAPILCFYGPPGCGKTSLCRSIARALDRKFIKCSLGGVNDEAEIRGHRRTYVGSRPGRIISSLKKVKVNNPVFLLDEIDKIGANNFKGDPSSALLEVLDPEQNFAFNDNYLEINYDLSNVLFICTANDLSNIPGPLMDRLELIEVDSYTLLDKVHIANDFLIKKELKNNGLTADQVEFSNEAIEYIIERYTKESGVRDLERKIASVLRKVVVNVLEGKIKEKITLTIKDIVKYLGVEDFDPTTKEKGKEIGVVTGLAWTPYGGDILPIEVTYFPGKGGILLTGKLGDVMKESCEIALDFVKANAKKYGVDSNIFKENDIHIHVPEGAVSKDGPSAGCAITCAIVSALTKKPVSGDIAMTGEVTLRGKSLAIGGLREKSLAALRSGIKTIFVPYDNKKTVSELPKEIRNNLEIKYMKNVDDALKVIF